MKRQAEKQLTSDNYQNEDEDQINDDNVCDFLFFFGCCCLESVLKLKKSIYFIAGSKSIG